MAISKIKPRHASEGRSIAAVLADRIDYGKNPEKTNGGLVIDLYPSNTLGSEEDIINSFKDSDTNWGYNTDFARLGTYVHELAMFNLPYFVETMDDINAVKELDMVKEWINKLETENDIKVVSLNLVQGYRNVVAGQS